MEHTPTTTLERQLIARAAALRRPVSGSLELTPLCNMNCRMCYVRLSPRQARAAGALRTGQQWAELAHPMARAGVLFLLLTGGEPLLVPGFKELYLALKAEGMVLTLNTNGTLLDEQWADFFARHKPRRVNITLYGADDAAYETLCRCPGGFEKALAAVRLLRARGVDVKLNGSVTPENVGEMDRLYAIARQLDVPMHMDAYMMPGGPGRRNPAEGVRLAPAQAAAARLHALEAETDPAALDAWAEEMLARAEHPGHWPDTPLCQGGATSFNISWQGMLRPCVASTAPTAPVFEQGFEAAWQAVSEAVPRLQRVNEACTRCRLRPLCNTCAAAARLETGRFDGLPDYICQSAEEFLRLLKQRQARRREADHGQTL